MYPLLSHLLPSSYLPIKNTGRCLRKEMWCSIQLGENPTLQLLRALKHLLGRMSPEQVRPSGKGMCRNRAPYSCQLPAAPCSFLQKSHPGRETPCKQGVKHQAAKLDIRLQRSKARKTISPWGWSFILSCYSMIPLKRVKEQGRVTQTTEGSKCSPRQDAAFWHDLPPSSQYGTHPLPYPVAAEQKWFLFYPI